MSEPRGVFLKASFRLKPGRAVRPGLFYDRQTGIMLSERADLYPAVFFRN